MIENGDKVRIADVEAYDKREDFRGSKFIKRSDAATIRAAQQP
jgi:hypothetical protein